MLQTLRGHNALQHIDNSLAYVQAAAAAVCMLNDMCIHSRLLHKYDAYTVAASCSA